MTHISISKKKNQHRSRPPTVQILNKLIETRVQRSNSESETSSSLVSRNATSTPPSPPTTPSRSPPSPLRRIPSHRRWKLLPCILHVPVFAPLSRSHHILSRIEHIYHSGTNTSQITPFLSAAPSPSTVHATMVLLAMCMRGGGFTISRIRIIVYRFEFAERFWSVRCDIGVSAVWLNSVRSIRMCLTCVRFAYRSKFCSGDVFGFFLWSRFCFCRFLVGLGWRFAKMSVYEFSFVLGNPDL